MIKTDTHYHIDLAEHPEQLLAQAKLDHISLIAPSMNPASFAKIIDLQSRSRNTIRWVGCGLHPEAVHTPEQTRLALQLSKSAPVIGEVGLPCYERPVTQQDLAVFREFCTAAAARNVPMIVHAVHKQAAVALSILQQTSVQRAVFHWLKADDHTLAQIVAAGYMVSVTPEVTYRQRDQQLLAQIPPDQLLVETDGPFEHQGPYAGRLTVPQMVEECAAYVANHFGITVKEWWQQHEENVQRIFANAL